MVRIRNGSFGKFGLVLSVIIVVGFLASIISVNAAPQLVVDCTQGYKTKEFYPVTNTLVCYVDQNTTINLQATDFSGPGGAINWTGEGVSADGSTYSFEVTKNVNLTVTVLKNNMIDQKKVEIHLTTPVENNCFPDWDSTTPVEVDKDKNKKEFARGDHFPLNANFYGSSCDFIITWQVFVNNALGKDVVIDNINEPKTFGTVSLDAPAGDWITIKAVLSHKNDPHGQTSERNFSFLVVDKPAAPEIVLDPGSPVAFSQLTVDWSGSKAQGDSNNFVYDCSFVLANEKGVIVDKGGDKAPFGYPRPSVGLSTQEAGIYTLTAICRDSFGTPATLTQSVYVGISNSSQNKPYLIFAQTTVYSNPGKNPVFYFNKTNKFGKDIKAEYTDISVSRRSAMPRESHISRYL